jgi:hypothetical protein
MISLNACDGRIPSAKVTTDDLGRGTTHKDG